MSYYLAFRVTCCKEDGPWFVDDSPDLLALRFDQVQIVASHWAMNIAVQFRGHSFIVRIIEATGRRGVLRKLNSSNPCIFRMLASQEEVESFGGLFSEPEEIHPYGADLY